MTQKQIQSLNDFKAKNQASTHWIDEKFHKIAEQSKKDIQKEMQEQSNNKKVITKADKNKQDENKPFTPYKLKKRAKLMTQTNFKKAFKRTIRTFI